VKENNGSKFLSNYLKKLRAEEVSHKERITKMSLKIGVIIGSNRPGRNAIKVAEWFKEQTDKYESMDFDFVDLAELDLPFMNEPDYPSAENYQFDYTKSWSKQVKSWDGVIIITPEYNRGIPAVLKNAIDYLYNEWNKKPLGLVSYGSALGYRSSADLHIIAVELQMAAIREQVAINIWQHLNEKGEFVGDEHIEKKAVTMLDQLKWWAEALRTAREQ